MRIYNISALQTFMVCPQKYYYLHDCRINPKGENTNALDVGTRVHKGALILNTGGTLDEALLAASENTEDIALGESWDFTDPGQARDLVKALDSFIKTADLGLKVHLAEEICAVQICRGSDPIYIVGKPDAIVTSERHPGGFWHLQYKTCGPTVSTEIYFRSYELAFHEVVYAMMAEHMGYAPCLGSIVVLIRKTKRPSCFLELFPLTDLRREASIRSIIETIEFIETGKRPMNPGSCVRYNRVCGFMTNCLGAGYLDDMVEQEPTYVDEIRNDPTKLQELLSKRRPT
jgi:hypothetical protein